MTNQHIRTRWRGALRWPVWAAALFLSWLCLASLTLAPAYAQDYAAAGQHFDAAQEAFGKGDFPRAAQEYQAAYAITKDPALLFSIGESWQRAGDGQKALDSYRAYLKDQPNAGDRPEVEKRIQALEAALVPAPSSPSNSANPSESPTPTAQQTSAAPPPVVVSPVKPPAAPEPPAAAPTPSMGSAATGSAAIERPTVLRTAAWVSTAVAVALGTAGAIVGLGAQNRADELRRRTTLLIGDQPPIYDENQRDAYETLMSEGKSYNVASIALLSVAGAAAVTSTVLFIADFMAKPKEKARSSAALRVLPTGMAVWGRF